MFSTFDGQIAIHIQCIHRGENRCDCTRLTCGLFVMKQIAQKPFILDFFCPPTFKSDKHFSVTQCINAHEYSTRGAAGRFTPFLPGNNTETTR